jgi:Ca2+-binding RTX toxin-like protein
MTASATSSTTALSATSFIGSLGVNVHMAYTWTPYGDVTLVENSLAYLGIVNVRDNLYPKPIAEAAFQSMADLGYKFDFIITPAEESISTFVSMVDSFAETNPNAVLAVEGPNEVDIFPFTYNGGSGLANAAQFQQDFYDAFRADHHLDSIPVYNLSSVASATDDLQLGDLSGAANYANGHFYLHDDRAPILTQNTYWPLPNIYAPGLPMVITETGYTTNPYNTYSGIDEAGQAKYTLDSLMDFFKAGVQQTFIYELLDEASDPANTNSEYHYGLFNNDGSPKLVATALHNLTSILSDPGSAAFTPGSLDYTITNLTAAHADQLLLEKSSGVFDLVLWAEPTIWDPYGMDDVAAPTDRATVNFAQVEGSVFVFDPLFGDTPIAKYTDVQQIQVDVTDHPIIIEVADGSAPPVTSLPTAPVIAGFSPDSNIVGDSITNARTLTLTGVAEANSTVNIFDGTMQLGTAPANSNGTWSFVTGILADGAHSLTATDTDAAGNTGIASSALAVTVDTVAPNAPVIVGDAIFNTNEVTLTGTAEANSTLNVFDGTTQVGTATANDSGAWTVTTGTLADGTHSFTAMDTDAAGNTSEASRALNLTIDTAVPTISNTIVGVTINGTRSANIIDGAHGIKGVFPTNGDDTINGRGGNDTINGLNGNDLLTGGSGNDIFVFNPGFGNDVITDFYTGNISRHHHYVSHDTLQFSHDVFSDVSAVLANAVQVGADVVITADATDSVTLDNVLLSSLYNDIHIV